MLCLAARDAFKSFDKKSEDKIRVGDIESAMKRIGHNIKPDWLEKIEHMIDAEGFLSVSTISGIQFRWLMVKYTRSEETHIKRHILSPCCTLTCYFYFIAFCLAVKFAYLFSHVITVRMSSFYAPWQNILRE